MEEGKICVTHFFGALSQITNVNICHKVTHEYIEVIRERWWLIFMDIIDTEMADGYDVADNDGDALDEEYGYYSVRAGKSTIVYE